jgi:hypothetical protein
MREPVKKSSERAPELTGIFEDFELRRLLLVEFEALRAHKANIPAALKAFYTTLGGTPINAKLIYMRVVELYARKKLEDVDLPGPDTLYKEKIFEYVIKFVGESFDDLFADK